MVTYHYVNFNVSIIIDLEVININVRNFNFPIGFYSNPDLLWTPQNMTLLPVRIRQYKEGEVSKQDELWANAHLWYPRSSANSK